MITGKVFDEQTKEPIWNASIYVSDSLGKITEAASGTTSWFDGTYKFTPASGIYITCSCVGYASKTVAFSELTPVIHFPLSKTATELPEVEIIDTPIKTAKKLINYVIAGFALATGAYLLNSLTNSKTRSTNEK